MFPKEPRSTPHTGFEEELLQKIDEIKGKSEGLRTSTMPEPQLRARDAFAANKALFDNAEEQVMEFGSGTAGADPKFANPGLSQAARDKFDIARMIDSHQREVRQDHDDFRQHPSISSLQARRWDS